MICLRVVMCVIVAGTGRVRTRRELLRGCTMAWPAKARCKTHEFCGGLWAGIRHPERGERMNTQTVSPDLPGPWGYARALCWGADGLSAPVGANVGPWGI